MKEKVNSSGRVDLFSIKCVKLFLKTVLDKSLLSYQETLGYLTVMRRIR